VAEEIRQRFPQVKTRTDLPDGKVDLLVNATSVGLKRGDGLPLDEEQFPVQRAAAVYDMIYRPAETTLLKVAKAAGCRTANGTGMLLHQGARALELWTGRTAPVEIMRDALVKNVYGD
jgi:shikimate dehydrogenase